MSFYWFFFSSQFSPIKNVESISRGRNFLFLFIIFSNLGQLLALPVAKQQNASFQCFLDERVTVFFIFEEVKTKLVCTRNSNLVRFDSLVSALAKVTGKQRQLTTELWCARYSAHIVSYRPGRPKLAFLRAFSVPLSVFNHFHSVAAKVSTIRKRYFCLFSSCSWERVQVWVL